MQSAADVWRVTFSYWGRRGLSAFALDLARAALRHPRLAPAFCIARQNERFHDFVRLDGKLEAIDAFSSIGRLPATALRLPRIRRQLLRHVDEHRPDLWIELMPHVFSPFLMPALVARGVRYATMVHDAAPHPGDARSAAAFWWIGKAMRQADAIITLSGHVAAQLRATVPQAGPKLITLALPDFDLGVRRPPTPPAPHERWRLLFLGRVLPYKGLSLCLDMVEALRRRGIGVDLTVAGSGSLGRERERVAALGAQLINRWLSDAEIAQLLSRTHAVVLSHVEASQSGVAAAAAGAGVPVIATPVGGLREQVQPRITGTLAARVDAEALADAAVELLAEPLQYRALCERLTAARASRSVDAFVARCLDQLARVIGGSRDAPGRSAR